MEGLYMRRSELVAYRIVGKVAKDDGPHGLGGEDGLPGHFVEGLQRKHKRTVKCKK
jgi:hypothetical protein